MTDTATKQKKAPAKSAAKKPAAPTQEKQAAAHYFSVNAKRNGKDEPESLVLYVAVYKAGKRGGATSPLKSTRSQAQQLLSLAAKA